MLKAHDHTLEVKVTLEASRTYRVQTVTFFKWVLKQHGIIAIHMTLIDVFNVKVKHRV